MANKVSEAMFISDEEYNVKMKKAVTDRLNRRDQSRASELKQNRTTREENIVAEEKSSFFTKQFQDELINVHNMVQCQDLLTDDRFLVIEHFDAITASYQRLQKFFNDSIMFLPAYESRKAQSQLAELQEMINKKRDELLPKKKFAFKAKSKKSAVASNGHTKGSIAQLKEAAAQKYASKVSELEDDCVLKDKSGETITLYNDKVELKDLSLSHLQRCVVYIYGAPGTVHISDVENSTFVIGPVSGSVFVERCVDSVIATGCQQLRVHHTRNTDFYLHVTSRAIIEDTKDVRFSPYTLHYPDLEKHYVVSGLDLNVNNWSSIDDFNWLAMDSQSPNWQVLDQTERKTQWQ